MLVQAYCLQFPSGHCYTEELKGEFQIHIQFEGDEICDPLIRCLNLDGEGSDSCYNIKRIS